MHTGQGSSGSLRATSGVRISPSASLSSLPLRWNSYRHSACEELRSTTDGPSQAPDEQFELEGFKEKPRGALPNMPLQATVTRTRVGEYAQRGSRHRLNAGR
jgi:hypothetical protein